MFFSTYSIIYLSSHFFAFRHDEQLGVVYILIMNISPLFQRSINIHYNYIVDRKSTRLNSSHVRISYAVFCLKKKKKKKQIKIKIKKKKKKHKKTTEKYNEARSRTDDMSERDIAIHHNDAD